MGVLFSLFLTQVTVALMKQNHQEIQTKATLTYFFLLRSVAFSRGLFGTAEVLSIDFLSMYDFMNN